MLIDSHAHIDLPNFDKDREQVFARARQGGIRAVINIGLDAESSRASLEMAKQYDDVFSTVGFHPHEASKMDDDDIKTLAELAQDERVVAVGEIGLDFYRNLSPRQSQEAAFRKQLDLAVELGLPVVVHCRQAHREVFNILNGWVRATLSAGRLRRGVIHCFSGDIELAQKYIEIGFYISLAGSVTYPSAGELVEVAREIPLNRLLLETDAPFLAPQAYRGKRNEPAYVALIAEKVAQVRGVPRETVAGAAAKNTISLFNLPVR
ncbi:MAG TPA: TatD family hydrolase [Dehalococcoidales bacterium]|nr:TatD family hydrolase [Dehalococcoidales bacterium]